MLTEDELQAKRRRKLEQQKQQLNHMVIIPNTISHREDRLSFAKQSIFNKKQFTEISVVEPEHTIYKSFDTSQLKSEEAGAQAQPKADSREPLAQENSESDLDSRVKRNFEMRTYEKAVLEPNGTRGRDPE